MIASLNKIMYLLVHKFTHPVLSPVGIGAYHPPQQSNIYSHVTMICVYLRRKNMKKFKPHDVFLRAKSSVPGGPDCW